MQNFKLSISGYGLPDTSGARGEVITRIYKISFVEAGITIGSFAWFFMFFLIFVKTLPAVSIAEIKEILPKFYGEVNENIFKLVIFALFFPPNFFESLLEKLTVF